MTSAPKSPITVAAAGPATKLPTSSTLIPARIMRSSPCVRDGATRSVCVRLQRYPNPFLERRLRHGHDRGARGARGGNARQRGHARTAPRASACNAKGVSLHLPGRSARRGPHRRRSHAMTTSAGLTVAIVGTGIGGTEMAGYLGIGGARVRVHDVRPEAVGGIRERGGLDVSGIVSGFAPIERATTDLAEAVEGAGLIAVTTVNNDHEAVAAALAPLLRDGHIV